MDAIRKKRLMLEHLRRMHVLSPPKLPCMSLENVISLPEEPVEDHSIESNEDDEATVDFTAYIRNAHAQAQMLQHLQRMHILSPPNSTCISLENVISLPSLESDSPEESVEDHSIEKPNEATVDVTIEAEAEAHPCCWDEATLCKVDAAIHTWFLRSNRWTQPDFIPLSEFYKMCSDDIIPGTGRPHHPLSRISLSNEERLLHDLLYVTSPSLYTLVHSSEQGHQWFLQRIIDPSLSRQKEWQRCLAENHSWDKSKSEAIGCQIRMSRWEFDNSVSVPPKNCDKAAEPSERDKELARRPQEEVKRVKAEQRRLGKGEMIGGAKPWIELEGRVKRIEEERRTEERMEELAKPGIVMEEEAETENKKDKKGREKRWTKASLTKELELRRLNLQGRRKQSLAEKLVLPFALKKILADEWEYIAHCEMLPNLPVPVSVRGALNQYLESKLDVIGGSDKAEESQSLTSVEAAAAAPQDDAALKTGRKSSSTGAKQKEEPKKAEKLEVSGEAVEKAEDLKRPSDVGPPSSEYPSTTAAGSHDVPSEFPQDKELAKKQQEWKDMVEGIAMLFDQSLSKHLLYPNEHAQLELLQQNPETARLLPSDVYGCEHLLRFFVRLPDLLAGRLSDVETRPIYSKMNDLVRFLQEHQATLFTQTHHPIKRPGANAITKKRKERVGSRPKSIGNRHEL